MSALISYYVLHPSKVLSVLECGLEKSEKFPEHCHFCPACSHWHKTHWILRLHLGEWEYWQCNFGWCWIVWTVSVVIKHSFDNNSNLTPVLAKDLPGKPAETEDLLFFPPAFSVSVFIEQGSGKGSFRDAAAHPQPLHDLSAIADNKNSYAAAEHALTIILKCRLIPKGANSTCTKWLLPASFNRMLSVLFNQQFLHPRLAR